ncbi:prolipoprotein diacylglyceryl transferase [Hymenobacter sp. NST-14]|uniref:prolipoprotein diacylglyceryl transferase family protein n=1 Tax=Hymenobacter piscis TaxID=2839984 RepID=UPI001C02A73C|nr:prolipoprotein diacylglyceryl transferase family protein [Hymenobacter piscis]MBT9393555.1 prolipoprotein diacylglyceryl transferase [Hymenobacter piscis]
MLLSTLAPAWTLAVPADPHYDFYTPFYVLAFALNLALLVWEGWRRGYALRPWLVVLACTTLAFILGTKLLALTAPEWQSLLHTGRWPASEARTVLGGALAGTLTLLALRRPFGFSWHVFDAFTLPMCAALVVQCLGCILTGCCFGEATAGGWGFTYPPDTLPYLVQAVQGQLPRGAAHSLPVHPTQLYSLLLCAGVALVLLMSRRRTWPGGSQRLLHLGLLLTGRFLIEFWRDPAGEQAGSAMHSHAGLALKQVQWVLLLLGPAVLALWVWRVRRGSVRRPETGPVQHPVRNLLAVAALLALTAWLGPVALVRPEVLVIKTLLLAVVVLEGGALLLGAAEAARPARVALPLGLACTVFVLTSQAPVADSTHHERFTTISGSLSTGSFERLQNTGSGGCGGSSQLLAYRHRYTTGTLDVSSSNVYHTPDQPDWGGNTYGVRLHAGSDQQRVLLPDTVPFAPDYRARSLILAINPYMRMERHWVGFGAGLMVGSLGFHRINFGDEQSALDVQASVRIGPRKIVYGLAEYNFLGYGSANPQHRLGLGTGFNGSRWQLLAGAATAKDYEILPGQSRWSGFVEAQGQFSDRWQASTFLLLGNPNQRQAGLRLGYRIPRR